MVVEFIFNKTGEVFSQECLLIPPATSSPVQVYESPTTKKSIKAGREYSITDDIYGNRILEEGKFPFGYTFYTAYKWHPETYLFEVDERGLAIK